MKNFFSISFLAATLLFVSCKKEAVNNPGNGNPGNGNPVPSKKLVASTINGKNTLTYNPDGTPNQIIIDHGTYVYKKVFSYSAGKASYISWLGNKKGEVGEYTLVNGKAVAFQWTYFDAFEAPIGTYNETYTYNAKGLVEKHFYNNGMYWQLDYDASNNVTVMTYRDAQGQALEKTEYTYGNQPDLSPAFGYLTNWGHGFFLSPYSKHLPVSEKSTDLVTQQVTGNATISYELDAHGYVLKGKWHGLLPGNIDYEWTNSFQ